MDPSQSIIVSQVYETSTVLHRLELFVKMRIMGMKGTAVYQPLKEDRAVELGSEILGEMFLYTVAASYIVYEYWRSVKREQKKEEDQSNQILVLEKKTSRLESDVAGLRQIIQELEQARATRTQPVKAKSS